MQWGLSLGVVSGRWQAVSDLQVDREDPGDTAEAGGEAVAKEQLGSGAPTASPLPHLPRPGSPFRDEITLAILQLQENNRLEILKRKWWEGGRCPKEEDHRAKGQPPHPPCPPETRGSPMCNSPDLWLPHQVWAWRTLAASLLCSSVASSLLSLWRSWNSYGPHGGRQSPKR